ncbi:MAG: TMEM165/GDT1 family protein [Polyangiaceae bacterium]|nr:TMEM165/GDT1 family protein [Polyangiaceae bacterium]
MSKRRGKAPRGPHGTRFLGGPDGAEGRNAGGSGEEPEGGERSAQLPAELPPESYSNARVVAGPAAGTRGETGGHGPVEATPLPWGARRSQYEGRPIRESLLIAMRQQRTSFYEVGDLARRLSMVAPGLGEASLVTKQLAVSFAVALAVVLFATMALAAGTMRVVLGVLAGTVATTLAAFGALRLVSGLGSRRGAHQLPGSALIWVGGILFVVAAVTVALTWGVSEVTRPLMVVRPPVRLSASPSASASAVVSAGMADANVERGSHANVGRGVLYVPPDFSAPDGVFDLIIHYHGNTELVQLAVAAAKVNALVLIVNYGDGSDKYVKPLQNQTAFDQLLGAIEATAETRLQLATPRIRRVALSSWSAGYGATNQILTSRSRLDRVDAVLLMDSIHASFLPGSKNEVHPVAIKSLVDFARRAAAGEKLMVITHSSIETEGYASTTQATDALLATLGIERKEVTDPAASPPPIKDRIVINAYPTGELRWLTVTSEARQKGLTVLGCRGNGKGDHIAHLTQMSVTVLPPLVKRWR